MIAVAVVVSGGCGGGKSGKNEERKEGEKEERRHGDEEEF